MQYSSLRIFFFEHVLLCAHKKGNPAIMLGCPIGNYFRNSLRNALSTFSLYCEACTYKELIRLLRPNHQSTHPSCHPVIRRQVRRRQYLPLPSTCHDASARRIASAAEF
jgi:hypothetical protein